LSISSTCKYRSPSTFVQYLFASNLRSSVDISFSIANTIRARSKCLFKRINYRVKITKLN
jgi:hypothetical protein